MPKFEGMPVVEAEAAVVQPEIIVSESKEIVPLSASEREVQNVETELMPVNVEEKDLEKREEIHGEIEEIFKDDGGKGNIENSKEVEEPSDDKYEVVHSLESFTTFKPPKRKSVLATFFSWLLSGGQPEMGEVDTHQEFDHAYLRKVEEDEKRGEVTVEPIPSTEIEKTGNNIQKEDNIIDVEATEVTMGEIEKNPVKQIEYKPNTMDGGNSESIDISKAA